MAILLAGCAPLPLAPDPTPTEEEEESFDVDRRFTVGDSAELQPTPTADAAAVWDLFVLIASPEFVAEEVVAFEVGDDPASDYSAYVMRHETKQQRWVLAANLAYATADDELAATLIHEFAHMLSLGPDQVTRDAMCATIWVNGGCMSPRSHILAFQHEFWDGYGSAAPLPDDDDLDAAWEFYEAHEDDFVTDYAAVNVSEDFAESFTAFVLEERPEAEPEDLWNEKIDFFWTIPEYARIRDRIRADLEL
ncbi:NADH:ubiquinone oxidoreductase subunit 4 (chain M) [Microbacterium fluvii]|uniref:NADH:ubiquinone oxidoreductase subunit 4 (Chain M) n=1 Tax=Microbacterium fluvii TaxID=415215 RepID=A0ABW2HDW7_9MICO|nr:NADH:ubiquinone oxidoreductase subunit 4 (chain M) [Microbacterium fluvii]MCU4671584.1 NADH:ubiquinone oxidoreductase subunit 4 (chain M) [Microbacterium fluvii]